MALTLQMAIVFLSALQQYDGLKINSYVQMDNATFEHFIDDMDLDSNVEEDGEGISTIFKEVAPGQLKLGIKQISKCGSTFLSKLMPKIAKRLGVRFKNVGETTGLGPSERSGTFIIASIRNPCSYYPSLWAFQAHKSWAHAQNILYDCFDFETNGYNREKFYNWMDVVQGTQHGIMTLRQWEAMVDGQRKQTNTKKVDGHNGSKCWEDNMPTCAKQFDDSKVETAMRTYSPRTAADCWVHLETMENDLKTCLTIYEEHAGVQMDWAHFETELQHLKHVNPSSHATCESFYEGPEGKKYKELIKSQDAYIFDKFGYGTCCGAPTQPMQ